MGRYIVLERIGQGGTGVVYKAYDPTLDRRVALKVLRQAPSEGGEQERLVREGKSMARLAHPNVAAVYDVGTHGDRVFVAMEFVEGQTLRRWLKSPRTLHEVLATFVQAGRGLEAAHQAGIVHLDFKPDNVLVGADGRVRVVDFGLAHPPSRTERASERPPAAAGAATLDTWLTGHGVVGGTPRYMPPEQLEGERLNETADQFAFCASLWEALFGESPFEGEDLLTLLDNLRASKPREPRRSDVPGWVVDVLTRGLAATPSARYPTMTALLEALERDPSRVRRQRLLAVGAAILVAGAVAWGARAERGAPDPCAHPERDLANVWDDGMKARVRAAFGGTGRPYADDTAERAIHLLDRYSSDYVAMRGVVCVAARDRKQSSGILDLRDACLARRRGQLDALTALLAKKPDVDVLDGAVLAASKLLPVSYCADTEALTARVHPPEDPALRARVATLQLSVDRVEALYETGKYDDALAANEPLLPEVEPIAYPPLIAQVKWWDGELRERQHDYEGAKALLREAATLATEGGDDVLAAYAWKDILFILAERQRRVDEASAIRSVGPTLLARARDDRLRVNWLAVEGLALARMGQLEEGRACEERAVALGEKVLGADHPLMATVQNNLGIVRYRMKDWPGAIEAYSRALSIREKAIGPSHPLTASSLNNLCGAWADTGDLAHAQGACERALAIWEAVLDPDHPELAQTRGNLAAVLDHKGEWPRALALFEQVLAIFEKAYGADHPDIVETLDHMGHLALELGDAARSASLLQRAVETSERVLAPGDHDLAQPLAGLGRARVRLGKLDLAGQALTRALAIVDKPGAGQDDVLVEALLGVGELDMASGKAKQAVTPLERALGAAAAEDTVCEIELALADALWQSGGERARAEKLATDASARYEKLGHVPGRERAARWLREHG
jgi:serine/threonine-protein kinase